MEHIRCNNCGGMIPEDSFVCNLCNIETGLYDDNFFDRDISAEDKSKHEELMEKHGGIPPEYRDKKFEEDLKNYGGRPQDNRDGKFGFGEGAIILKGFNDYRASLGSFRWFDQSEGSSFGDFLPYSELQNNQNCIGSDQSHKSFTGDPNLPFDQKNQFTTSFYTEILSLKKQDGSKYSPKLKTDKIWSNPILEVGTRHGIYITHAQSSWLFECFERREVLVWSEESSRAGYLWLHQAPPKDPSGEIICAGCCNKIWTDYLPF